MRVMSYNLRFDNPGDRENRWGLREPAVKWVWRHVNADLVGIQEGLAHQVRDLSHWFPSYTACGVGRNADGSGEQVTIFYKSDRFKCLDKGNFWLSDTPEKPGSKSFGNQVVRMASWVSLLDSSDKTLLFLNTHLDHENEPARRKGADLILEFLHSRPKHDGYVITGDFNDTPTSRAVRAFSSKYTDALAATGKPGPTFHAFTGQGLFRIDYIFLSTNLKPVSGEVVTNTPEGIYPSDHFPVYVDFDW